MNRWLKFELNQLENFSVDEFRCRCGKAMCLPERHSAAEAYLLRTARILQGCRSLLGAPLKVNSAYRCALHKMEERKPLPGSHALGTAVDISTRSLDEGQVTRLIALWERGTDGHCGVGVYAGFVHLDCGHARRNRPAKW